MSTLLKLCLSGYGVKPRICAFYCKYLKYNSFILWGKKFSGTRHLGEKSESTLDRFRGGCTVRSAGS